MIVLFVGPTLSGCTADVTDIDVRPPARQGDIGRAVLDGARVIGLVDGNFEATAAVWHKEILHALANGVRVFGAASMGALRAAECAAFGMVPVGRIAMAYADGTLDDDAAVAQLHAPAELDYLPLTETLVDARATLAGLVQQGLLTGEEADQAERRAEALFFKDRTIEAMFAGLVDGERLLRLYRQYRVPQKQLDALELVGRLREAVRLPQPPAPQWKMAEPRLWKTALGHLREDAAPTD